MKLKNKRRSLKKAQKKLAKVMNGMEKTTRKTSMVFGTCSRWIYCI